MLNLQNETVAKLRDRLKERGERPSLFATDLSALKQTDVPADVLMRFDAICEAMYLMAKADGKLDPAEADTLRGAIRELSDGTVRSVHIQKMIEGADARLAKEGLEARIKGVAAKLVEDPGTAGRRSRSPRPSRSPTTRSPTRRTTCSTRSPRRSASTRTMRTRSSTSSRLVVRRRSDPRSSRESFFGRDR
jgi:hypothetical protein